MLEEIKKLYPKDTWVYSATKLNKKPQRVSGEKYGYSRHYLGNIYADDSILLYDAENNIFAEIIKTK